MNGSPAPLHDATPPPPAPMPAPAPTSAPAQVTLDDRTLVLTGEVDRTTATHAQRALPPARLADVDTVDLTRATYLDTEAVHLLLRCLRARQHRTHAGPSTRLQVKGADARLRDDMAHLGVLPLVNLAPVTR